MTHQSPSWQRPIEAATEAYQIADLLDGLDPNPGPGLYPSPSSPSAVNAVGGVPSKMVGASRLVGSLIFSLEALSTAFFLARLAPALPQRWLSSLLGTVCITVSMMLHWRCTAHPSALIAQLPGFTTVDK